MRKIKKSELENYIDKPVYVKGFSYNKRYDGWATIYKNEKGKLMFNYEEGMYSVDKFLVDEDKPKIFPELSNAFYTGNKEDAIATCRKNCVHYNVCGYHIDEETEMTIMECINFKPYCKKCKYRKTHTCAITGIKTLFCDYGEKPVVVEPEHYCSYGEV